MFRLTAASLGLSDFPSLPLLLSQTACALLEGRSSVAQLSSKTEWLAFAAPGLMTSHGWLQPARGRGPDVLVPTTGLGHSALS